MAYGFACYNNNNVITISSDVYCYGYIGQATFTNTFKEDAYSFRFGGTASHAVAGSAALSAIYTITSVYPPLAFVSLSGNTFVVTSVYNTGGNNWTIIVYGNSFSVVPTVKCFARLAGAGGGGYGLRIYDANGNRTFDSSDQMLVIAQTNLWAATSTTTTNQTQSITLSGFSNPMVYQNNTNKLTGYTSSPSGSSFAVTSYTSGWRGSQTQLIRETRGISPGRYIEDAGQSGEFFNPAKTYLIDGANYT